MSITITTLVLGPLDNNTHIITDQDTMESVVIDPSFEQEQIIRVAEMNGWKLKQIWITHGHFDHLAGARPLSLSFVPQLPIGIHPDDLGLWRDKGRALQFGFNINTGNDPELSFKHGQVMMLGRHHVEIRHTPGHSAGHVTFYIPSAGCALCGDVIFAGSIGRTDLPGGDFDTLIRSIREQILTLSPETRLLCGHGPETSVQEEIASNPFL